MSELRLITYNNKPYSIIIRESENVGKKIACISVHGAKAEGDTEGDAIMNLRIVLGKMEQRTNIGKDKLLLG